MDYSTFESLVKILQEQDLKMSTLYDQKIDLIDFVDPYHTIISILFREMYGEEGYDWFTWFCYENDYGNKEPRAWDAKGNPICYDLKSLYEYLKKLKYESKI